MNRYESARNEDARVVHVRYDGQSHDIPFSDIFPPEKYASLGIPEDSEVTAGGLSTDTVRTALAQYFDKNTNEFSDYIIEPHENGNMTVRPKATFGI